MTNLPSDADVESIWKSVSKFVEKQMLQRKGVEIPELGTFTLVDKMCAPGNKRFKLVKRPVFLISEKFTEAHGLTSKAPHLTDKIPIVPLDFAALALECNLEPDIAESCVSGKLIFFRKSINTKPNVQFVFPGIGCLDIRDNKARMKFHKTFKHIVDGRCESRPCSSESLLSYTTRSRKHSRCSTPTIVPPPRIAKKKLLFDHPPPVASALIEGLESLKQDAHPSRDDVSHSRCSFIHPHVCLPPLHEATVQGYRSTSGYSANRHVRYKPTTQQLLLIRPKAAKGVRQHKFNQRNLLSQNVEEQCREIEQVEFNENNIYVSDMLHTLEEQQRRQAERQSRHLEFLHFETCNTKIHEQSYASYHRQNNIMMNRSLRLPSKPVVIPFSESKTHQTKKIKVPTCQKTIKILGHDFERVLDSVSPLISVKTKSSLNIHAVDKGLTQLQRVAEILEKVEKANRARDDRLALPGSPQSRVSTPLLYA